MGELGELTGADYVPGGVGEGAHDLAAEEAGCTGDYDGFGGHFEGSW